MSDQEILRNWVCMNPFKYLDIQENFSWVCCPSWITLTPISRHYELENNGEITIAEDWFNGEIIKDIRHSVLDGSYEYCDKKVCPHLSEIVNNKQPTHPLPIITRAEFQEQYLKEKDPITFVEEFKEGPEEILFGFDRACNLKCPSCRDDIVINLKEEDPLQIKKRKIADIITDNFAHNAKKLMITGSGDPFYSRAFRNYLQEFPIDNYPNMEMIHIITNGNLLNKKMWDSLNAKEFIRSIEFSVDAGTQHTYETVTRLNGDWNKLLQNISFVATQEQINDITLSMVVSELNYTEMHTFWLTMTDLLKDFQGNLTLNFRRIVHWQHSAYRPEDIRNISVFDRDHPQHDNFLTETNKIKDLPFVSHNFHEVI